MFRRALILAAVALSAFAWADRDEAWVAGRKNYWAFQKPVRDAAPALKDPWIRTPVDAFLLSAMKAKGLTPAAPLDRERLFRRLSLDLTGLMPTPGELDLFLSDKSANAYEKAVERLLASPHYGERWALRWLDVVRYADTNGYELDLERPHAWRYRDYVVRSFQQDKPYDRFVKEQIAGDELYPGNNEALIATGFHRAGPIHIVGGNQDLEANRQEVLVEMTAGVSAAFMGLTVGCARCHNHKFDPILQKDYFRLKAFFAPVHWRDDLKLAEMGAPINARMGLNTWAAFVGTNDQAAVAGDVAMLASEVQPVLKALRKGGLDVVAIHHHMTGTKPTIFFLHYWGTGPAEKLATAFRAAVSETGRRKAPAARQ